MSIVTVANRRSGGNSFSCTTSESSTTSAVEVAVDGDRWFWIVAAPLVMVQAAQAYTEPVQCAKSMVVELDLTEMVSLPAVPSSLNFTMSPVLYADTWAMMESL